MRISDWSSDVCSSDLRCRIRDTDARFRCRAGARLRGYHPTIAQGARGVADAAALGARLVRCRGRRLYGVASAQFRTPRTEVGRASGRARVWQVVEVWGVAVSLKKK